MAKKSLGYVELEWECPNCRSRNPGSTRICTNCGTPQPDDVEFQQAAKEEIITDEAKIAAAQAGPDIHCAYCGARNPATNKTCKQCGADLTEGTARATGQVLGALQTAEAPPVTCPSCGATNPATAQKCSQCGETLTRPKPAQPAPTVRPGGCGKLLPVAIAGGVAIVALIVLFVVLGSRRTAVVGEVADVNWKRAIAVEALVPVVREAWADQIPAGAEIGRCRQEVYKVQDQPAPGAREVCGTAYVVDKGSGYGEAVQDCKYEILQDKCQYNTLAWQPAAPLVMEGANLNPQWPALVLGENQRAGGRSEEFAIKFDVDGKMYTYRPADQEEFTQYSPGSQWRLKVNSFGSVQVEGPR